MAIALPSDACAGAPGEPSRTCLAPAQARVTLQPGDDVLVNGVPATFVKMASEGGRMHLIVKPDPKSASVQRVECTPDCRVVLLWTHLPSFDELTRCRPFTKVTVRGQAASFSRARVASDGTQMLEVLTDRPNFALAAASERPPAEHTYAGTRYSVGFDRAGLRIGTPPGSLLNLRDALTGLRLGDRVTIDGTPAGFVRIGFDDTDDLALGWILVHDPAAANERLAALCEDNHPPWPHPRLGMLYRIAFTRERRIRLVSSTLPTFEDLLKVVRGTKVTLSTVPGPLTLESALSKDGTQQFVVLRAAAGQKMPLESLDRRRDGDDWLHRIRFQDSGLRLAQA